MRYLVTARRSQEEKGSVSIADQVDTLTEWVTGNGDDVAGIVIDDGVSGGIEPWSRPDLGPWLTDPAKMAQYDGIVALNVSRISRDYADTPLMLRWCRKHGKELHAHQEFMHCPGTSDSQWTNYGTMAAHYREQVRINTINALNKLRSNGHLTGRPPWGYISAGVKGAHYLAPTDAGTAYAEEIFKRVAKGDSLNAVARWLDSANVPTAKGGDKWWSKSVGQIINNRTYMGQRMDAGGNVVHTCPELVDAGLWQQANNRLRNAPVGRRGTTKLAPAMLTSLLFCGECAEYGAPIRGEDGKVTGKRDGIPARSPMYRILTGGPGNRLAYYRCSGSDATRTGCGNLISLTATDAKVSAWIASSNQPWTVRDYVGPSRNEIEIAKVAIQISDLDRREDEMSADEYDSQRAALMAEKRRLKDPANFTSGHEITRETSETIGEHLAGLSLAELRSELLKAARLYARKGGAIEVGKPGTLSPRVEIDLDQAPVTGTVWLSLAA